MVTNVKARLLNEVDLETALWKKIETHLKDRLQVYRAKNDGNLTLEETAKLRGRIQEVKSLLDLATSPVQPVNADE